MNATTTDPDPTTGAARTSGTTAVADAYVAEVRQHLTGLADDERDDLLDDLVAHVHEVSSHDSRPLDEALGNPATFATELLATAGLAPDRPRGIGARASSGVDSARRRARAAIAPLVPTLRAVRRHPWATATVDFLPELRPAWWVARGWLLVVGFWLIGANTWGHYALPEVLGSTLLGVLAGAGCAAASVRVARHRPTWRWRHAVDALAIVAAIAFLLRSDDLARANDADVVGLGLPYGAAQIRHPDGSAITNIHAYDDGGEPLERVRLFDQDGRPIEVPDSPDPYATPRGRHEVFGADGMPVWNVYPIEQFAYEWEPATGTDVQRPIPEPRLFVPPLPVPATEVADDGGTGPSPTTTSATDPAVPGTASTSPTSEPQPGS